MEKWKDIQGFVGKYQVSSLGQIRSLSYNNTNEVVIKKQVKNKKGKMEINLWRCNKAYPKTVARVVYETFSGKKLRKNQLINYLDGNSENCSFSNLFIVTKSKKTNNPRYYRHLKGEVWEDITGFDGKYQVSNTGRIKCLNFKNTKQERIMKTSCGNWNTPRIKLCINGMAKTLGVAKIVYETFSKTKVAKNEVVRYRDGNPNNCSFSNLYVISLSEEVHMELANDKRKRAKFDYYGELLTVRDIQKITGMPISTIWTRLNTSKWNIYEAVETPIYITPAHKKRKERLKNGRT